MSVSLHTQRSRSFLYLTMVALCGLLWLVACADHSLTAFDSGGRFASAANRAENQTLADDTLRLPVTEMVRFADPSAGFEARVPLHWTRTLLNTPDEPGITVSFESPRSDGTDIFADYLMIDIQPGSRVEVLEEPADERTLMIVAGESVYRERILLDNHPVADTHLDLVAWQLTVRKPGYSIAIYVVGERREEARLERVMIEFAYSFSMPVPPFLLT